MNILKMGEMVIVLMHNRLHLLSFFSPPVFSGASPVGLILSAAVAAAYKVAIQYEG